MMENLASIEQFEQLNKQGKVVFKFTAVGVQIVILSIHLWEK